MTLTPDDINAIRELIREEIDQATDQRKAKGTLVQVDLLDLVDLFDLPIPYTITERGRAQANGKLRDGEGVPPPPPADNARTLTNDQPAPRAEVQPRRKGRAFGMLNPVPPPTLTPR